MSRVRIKIQAVPHLKEPKASASTLKGGKFHERFLKKPLRSDRNSQGIGTGCFKSHPAGTAPDAVKRLSTGIAAMLAVTLLCANAPVLYAKAAAPYPEPAKAIVEEYDIPEEAWEQTSVITVGWSPTAGCPWRRSLLRTPLLVSDNITNGAHDLIFQRTGGGGETEYVRLACSDGVYTSPAGAEVLESLEGIPGNPVQRFDCGSGKRDLFDPG